ncbi:hypothetical protein HAX54_024767, partial [Datura stramonium]|nr:hypothetical protein [Datura stramonium]
ENLQRNTPNSSPNSRFVEVNQPYVSAPTSLKGNQCAFVLIEEHIPVILNENQPLHIAHRHLFLTEREQFLELINWESKSQPCSIKQEFEYEESIFQESKKQAEVLEGFYFVWVV